jgi:hypothetical protein
MEVRSLASQQLTDDLGAAFVAAIRTSPRRAIS